MLTGLVVVAILGWSYWRDVTGNRLIEIDPESLFTLLGVLGGIVALVNAVLFVVFRDQRALINLGVLVFVGSVLVVSLRRAQ
jgi:ABC-type polysaccharide/polyol phosphate export permease